MSWIVCTAGYAAVGVLSGASFIASVNKIDEDAVVVAVIGIVFWPIVGPVLLSLGLGGFVRSRIKASRARKVIAEREMARLMAELE